MMWELINIYIIFKVFAIVKIYVVVSSVSREYTASIFAVLKIYVVYFPETTGTV
jgi:hypothetical protein